MLHKSEESVYAYWLARTRAISGRVMRACLRLHRGGGVGCEPTALLLDQVQRS